jgi:hypothetical protein
VCGNEVPAAARCQRCGAPLAVLDACPCCGGEAGASPDGELRFACDLCGGPRLPRLDRAIRYSAGVVEHLRAADAARKARAGWRAAAIADGVLLPFVFLLFGTLVALFGASGALVAAAFFMLAPIAAFLVFALSRASSSSAKIGPALDAAWLAAAGDVARQTRGLTATTLAAKLGIAEPQAEELIALIDVNASLTPALLRIADPPADEQASQALREAALAPEGERDIEETRAPLVARIDPPTGKS